MVRTVEYDFEVKNAQQALAELRMLHDQFKEGKLKIEDWAEAKKNARTDSRNFADTFRLEQNLWMAAHPNVEKLTRAMSVMSSVMGTALAVQNALNIAQLVAQGQTSNILTVQGQLNEAQREYDLAIVKFGEDSIEAANARDKLTAAEQALKEAHDQQTTQFANNAVTMVTSGALIAASIVQILPRLAAMGITATVSSALYAAGMGIMSAATTAFSTISKLAFLTNPWFLLAAAIAIVAVLIITNWDAVVKFFTDVFGPVMEWLKQNWQLLVIVLTGGLGFLVLQIIQNWDTIVATFQSAWQAIVDFSTAAWGLLSGGFLAFWNGMVKIANGAISAIVKGIEGLVNSWIDGINGLIKLYNSFSEALHLGSISLVARVSLQVLQIPEIAAAVGYAGVVSQPTRFLAGEMGPEPMAIGQKAIDSIAKGTSPLTGISTGGGGSHITYVTVQGSLWALDDLYNKLDQLRERDIRDRHGG